MNSHDKPTSTLANPQRRQALARLATQAGVAGTTAALGGMTLPLQAHSVAAPSPAVAGRFDPVVAWPLIPIHAVLLPDGRVMSYGSDQKGQQGATLFYDIWTPSLGTGPESHLSLPNTTTTDIFCNGQVVVPADGKVLLTGGDKTINGVRNFGSADINQFDYQRNTLSPVADKLSRARWYPSVMTMPNGDVLVTGGLVNNSLYSITPDLYTPGKGWRKLDGATSDSAFGFLNWFYPRTWVAPNGQAFIVNQTGTTFMLDTAGTGKIRTTPLILPMGYHSHPSTMFAPGRILTIRGTAVQVVDLRGARPTATALPNLPRLRHWANLTALADGQLLLSGGSAELNKAIRVTYQTALWNPDTMKWTPGATAAKMRLYHSIAILLPDGRVLTGGGGAPGPETRLDAELYSPPYLFKADGTLAERPVIQDAPAYVSWGSAFSAQVQASGGASRVTLVRTGSITHSSDCDQRFMALSFKQDGSRLSITAPASSSEAPPGFYMLFVFDQAKVPAVAKIIRIGA
jgi:Domain of unknown function (DUF1929)/Glyoxal oxidase N-terminus